ncbi:hypothetical protein HHK36_010929 [Tetracentron sinense]|uniref:Uncharacterized protein n=1 Tax=Tetracentron sinense TaxID=13715 RepID=A0A835DGS4_TETSI|nr:hypothetical protein HHK36_010929 [Tetracentron sinense]
MEHHTLPYSLFLRLRNARSLESTAMAKFPRKFLYSVLSISVFTLLLFLSPKTSPRHSRSFSHAVDLEIPFPPPPKIAYFISGSNGDGARILRLLHAVYHPRNQYLLHLDRAASQQQREDLCVSILSVETFTAAENVNVVGKADSVNYGGSTPLASVLHGAAIMLRYSKDWDWFVNLEAPDYPLITQDDFLHVLSFVPKDFNFIEHTSNIGWKEYQRIIPIVVDPGLYLASKGGIFVVDKKRALPKAYSAVSEASHDASGSFVIGYLDLSFIPPAEFVILGNVLPLIFCSPSVILSRKLVEFSILGWDNLPRSLLLYFSNMKSSHRGYFQTLACNSKEFSNTVVNSDLRFVAWDNPRGKAPRNLKRSDLNKMLGTGAAFAGRFLPNDSALDVIDSVVLRRNRGTVAPGGWCVGRHGRSRDPCQLWGDINILRPGPAAKRFEKLLQRVMANTTFWSNLCIQH